MIDWGLAERVAGFVTPVTSPPIARLEALTAEVEAFAPRSAELVTAYTGLARDATLPDPEVVGRRDWTSINLRSMAVVLEPLVEKAGQDLGVLGGPLKAASGALLAAEAGALSGFLASRVLGQYEFPILDPEASSRLLFVGPNLLNAARTLQADDTSLIRWVALHETTHAVQFAGVPWLRAHLADRVGSLLTLADAKLTDVLPARPGIDDLRALARRVADDGVVGIVAGPERKAAIDELQAIMALIEGHAEHVMDAVGETELDNLAALRSGMQRRRRDRHPLVKLLERLIGFELKLRQYEQGKRFCDAVVAEAGIDGLNRAFAEPAALPRLDELDAPSAWLARVSLAT